MVDQRQPQAAGLLQRSQVQLLPVQQEVWRQAGLTQQKNIIRAQHQVRLPDVEERESEHVALCRLTERARERGASDPEATDKHWQLIGQFFTLDRK